MTTSTKNKELFKILIGAAWIDGTIQSEERDYLHQMAQEQGIADDPEIKYLLSEAKPIKITECYAWLENYLGDDISSETYQQLIDAISGLIYSDSNVDTEEAKLLTRLQLLDPTKEQPKSAFDKVLKTIQKLYRKAISQQS
jgi:uncharacterized tellurite resistance protein B-like protein